MTHTMDHISQLPDVAKALLEHAGDKTVWAIYGEMGAGKTTLIKALCDVLGVIDQTSSPTFALVNEYDSPGGAIYHFDFYRIQSEQEALDMGYEEYFYSGAYCFVEWPEKIPSLLPTDVVSIHLRAHADGKRTLVVQPSI